MSPGLLDAVTHAIQLIVAPVVMVSACAILSAGLLSRYSAVNDRLRLMGRERLELLAAAKPGATIAFDLVTERLAEIDTQIPLLLSRHRAIQDSVFALYGAAALFLADMFAIAGAALLNADSLAIIAFVIFLLGVGTLLISLLITVREISMSHQALYYEVRRIAALKSPTSDAYDFPGVDGGGADTAGKPDGGVAVDKLGGA